VSASEGRLVSPGLLAVVQSCPVLNEVGLNMEKAAEALSRVPASDNRLVLQRFEDVVEGSGKMLDRSSGGLTECWVNETLLL